MKKRICSFVLLLACLVTAMAGCGGQSSGTDSPDTGTAGSNKEAGSDEKIDELIIAFRATSVPSKDAVAKVEAALNEITKEKIQATVKLQISSMGDYNQQLQLMLTGNEQVDVIGVPDAMVSSTVSGGQVIPLDDLLEQYGQGIKDACGEELLRIGLYGDQMYFLPYIADQGIGYGYYVINKNLADRYNIDVTAIETYEDLEAAFAAIHENEPDVNVVVPRMAGNVSMVQNHYTWDPLGDHFGVLDNYGQSLDVVNLFETDSYRTYVDMVHEWFLDGYISADAAAGILNGQDLMKADQAFCYSFNNKPGALEQEELNCGCELYDVQLLPTFSYTSVAWQWAIAANSTNQQKAMEFLNLMYTDSEFLNLLVYGIEGEDYVVREDGRIGYPDGIDSSNVEYSLAGSLWQFGNEFNAYIWETNDADLWEQTKKWNEEGDPSMPYYTSKAFGFRFDSSSVSNEIASVSNVYKEYAMSLEYGASDPAEVLDEMNEKLYDAGLQKIIDAKQEQLNAWAQKVGVE